MSAPQRLRIVITGGGTGGHVTPAIAVHEALRARCESIETLWIGSHKGVEREAAARAGILFTSIQTGKLRRYLDFKTIPDAIRLPVGFVQALIKLRRFRPDVVFSTGGYVSVPTVAAGRFFAPVVIHEQTAAIGLANRINARSARVFAVTYETTARAAAQLSRNVVVTGNPIRAGLREGDPDATREAFGFPPGIPVLYVTGGSLGATPLNERIFGGLHRLLERTCVIHQTGSRSSNPDYDRALAIRASLPPELQSRYQPREFITGELAGIFALATLVVGRAGAGTVAELAHVGLPSILIPLPHAGGSEQERNANILAGAGAAVIIPESSATPERLLQEIIQLLDRPEQLASMATAARSVAREDAATTLAELILANAKR